MKSIALLFSGALLLSGLTALYSPADRETTVHPDCRVASISVDKMNVIYLGLENPVSVSIANVSSQNIEVEVDNGEVRKTGQNQYVVIPALEGSCNLMVTAPEMEAVFPLRCKPIPDPDLHLFYTTEEAMTSFSTNQVFGTGEFAKMKGIVLYPNDFDFFIDCSEDVRFWVCRISKDGEKSCASNEGLNLNDEVLELIQQCQRGDIYLFSDVQVKCQGDEAYRMLPNIAYQL